MLLLLLSVVAAASGSGNTNTDYDIVGPSSAGFLPSHALRFSEHPDAVVALPGDEVFFNCKTAGAGGGPEEVRWLHNGSLLAREGNDDGRAESRTAGGRGAQLTFKVHADPVKYAQQLGNYRCVAGGAGGIFVASHSATLRVAHMEQFSHFSSRSKEIEVFVGNDVAIDCRVPPSVPPAVIQFYKDDKPLTMLDSNAKYELLNGETLLVREVTLGDGGKYSCGATNHITSQSIKAPDFTELKVKVPEQYEKSRLTYRPKEKYQIQAGENLTIPCLASGHPTPEIIWTRTTQNPLVVDNNERLPSGHGCLTITNARELDGGSYMCAIYNGARRFLRRTTVVVLTPPVFITTPLIDDGVDGIKEGSSVFLHCQARGTPVPEVEWYFNGLPVKHGGHKKLHLNGTLSIPFARMSSDQGVYQCFVSNSVGSNASTPVTLRISRGNSSLYEEYEDSDSYSEDQLAFWHRPSLLDHLATVPPSRPEVEQTGRHSALLTWTVDTTSATLSGEAMPIQFFKIQFREFHRGGVRSQWRTLDDVINPRARSFEILGLKDNVRYRFRVVAVYANDDNLHGPLSRKFKLNKELDSEKSPRAAPVITQVLPLGPNSLRVGWKMKTAVSPAVVEGYFIYIRKSEAILESGEDETDQLSNRKRRRRKKKGGKFRKVTIIGHASHSYIFDELEPATTYEIKVEAFNFAGRSPPSRISRRTTWPKEDQEETGDAITDIDINDVEIGKNSTSSPTIGSPSTLDDNDRVLLYVGIAGGIAVVVLALVLFCSVISCLQRAKARKSFASSASSNSATSNKPLTAAPKSNKGYLPSTSDASAIHEKYLDTSRSISMSMMSSPMARSVDGGHNQRYFGGGVDRIQLPPSPSSGSSGRLGPNEAETSFLQLHNNNLSPSTTTAGSTAHAQTSSNEYSSNVELDRASSAVCREPLAPGGDDHYASSPSMAGDKCSLGYEVYTDEPSVISWKRRRRSEEIL